MARDSEILKALNKMEIDLPYITESKESKPEVDRQEVKSFFSMEEDEETQNLLEEYATEEEKASWSLEDFIVKTINNHADDAIENAKQLVKPKTDIFADAKGRVAHQKVVEESIQKIEHERVEQTKPEAIAKTMAAVEKKTVSESTNYDPEAGDRNFQRSLAVMKRELQRHIADIYKKESVQMLKKIESMGGGGGGGAMTREQRLQLQQSVTDIATLSADVGAFENVTESQRDQFQGYIALLSPVYFGGSATTFDIPLENVNTYLDVELDVYLSGGEFDYRVKSMKDANVEGYTGTGANGSPIVFDLEGLEITSSANIRVSMSFNPDDDGGRFQSRLLFNRHGGIPLSGTDFSIEASAIAMESGAEEEYAYTPNIQFFVGDTIDTNGPGDAGKVRFQIKSDVPGTVTMNEIAMFIQK